MKACGVIGLFAPNHGYNRPATSSPPAAAELNHRRPTMRDSRVRPGRQWNVWLAPGTRHVVLPDPRAASFVEATACKRPSGSAAVDTSMRRLLAGSPEGIGLAARGNPQCSHTCPTPQPRLGRSPSRAMQWCGRGCSVQGARPMLDVCSHSGGHASVVAGQRAQRTRRDVGEGRMAEITETMRRAGPARWPAERSPAAQRRAGPRNVVGTSAGRSIAVPWSAM